MQKSTDWKECWRLIPVRLIDGKWGMGHLFRRYEQGKAQYRKPTEEEWSDIWVANQF